MAQHLRAGHLYHVYSKNRQRNALQVAHSRLRMVDLQRTEGWHEWLNFCRLHSNSQVVKHSSFAGVELANCMSHCNRLPTSRQRRHSPAAFLRWHDSYDSLVILEPFLIPCEDPKSVALQEERFQVVTEHVTHLVRGAVSELEPLVEGLQVVEPHIFQSTEKDDEGTEVNEHVELDDFHGLRRARDVNTGPLVGAAVWARRNARNIHTIAFTTEPWPAGHSSQLGRVTPKMATVAAFWSIAQQHGALALGIMIRVVANEACGLGPGGCRGIIQAAGMVRPEATRSLAPQERPTVTVAVTIARSAGGVELCSMLPRAELVLPLLRSMQWGSLQRVLQAGKQRNFKRNRQLARTSKRGIAWGALTLTPPHEVREWLSL